MSVSIIIEIPVWTSHYNQILYSLLIYAQSINASFKIILDRTLSIGSAKLYINGKVAFLDYSDDFKFLDDPSTHQFYFKRSLCNKNIHENNIYPLNFHINFSYQPISLISKFNLKVLVDSHSRTELIRALDIWSSFTNDSHASKDISKFNLKNKKSYGGNILFMTRLWDPSRASDEEEEERRIVQNEFRIGACRTVQRYFPQSIIGLFPDKIAVRLAPDILLDVKKTSKKKYLKELNHCDIAIADDGLKNSTGWKFGEYVLSHKAIISTPLNTIANDFHENQNYISTGDRSDYKIIPDLICNLLKNDNFEEMQNQNEIWSAKYLEPKAYINHILNIMDVKSP